MSFNEGKTGLPSLKHLVLITIGIASIWGMVSCSAYKEEQQRQLSIERTARLAVSVLPQGTADQWLNYAEYRLSRQIVREGNRLVIARFPFTISASGSPIPNNGTFYVNLDHPYTIRCDSLSAAVIFDRNPEPLGIVAFHFFLSDTMPTDAPPRPHLPVDSESIAGKHLSTLLCNYGDMFMTALTTLPARAAPRTERGSGRR